VHKLDEEILYEKSNDEPEQPAFIQEFLEANSFKVNACATPYVHLHFV